MTASNVLWEAYLPGESTARAQPMAAILIGGCRMEGENPEDGYFLSRQPFGWCKPGRHSQMLQQDLGTWGVYAIMGLDGEGPDYTPRLEWYAVDHWGCHLRTQPYRSVAAAQAACARAFLRHAQHVADSHHGDPLGKFLPQEIYCRSQVLWHGFETVHEHIDTTTMAGLVLPWGKFEPSTQQGLRIRVLPGATVVVPFPHVTVSEHRTCYGSPCWVDYDEPEQREASPHLIAGLGTVSHALVQRVQQTLSEASACFDR